MQAPFHLALCGTRVRRAEGHLLTDAVPSPRQPLGVFGLQSSQACPCHQLVTRQQPLPLAGAISRAWPAAQGKRKGFGFQEEMDKGALPQVELNF